MYIRVSYYEPFEGLVKNNLGKSLNKQPDQNTPYDDESKINSVLKQAFSNYESVHGKQNEKQKCSKECDGVLLIEPKCANDQSNDVIKKGPCGSPRRTNISCNTHCRFL